MANEQEEGDATGGVQQAPAAALPVSAASDDPELPPELRMDDYDDEPGPAVTGDPAADDDDVMDEEEEEEDEEDAGAGMGVSFVEEPATGQVFAYESEGEDSDTEDNIIKPNDHVLLTATTEEV